MTIPEAAIEAATRALSVHWRDMHTNEALGHQRMLATFALEAALPAIREQIAKEIEEHIREPENTPINGWQSAVEAATALTFRQGLKSAAKIARGES